MKKLSLLVLCFTFSMISLAQAGPLADRAQDVADRLNSAERNLTGRDADDIARALEDVDYLLQRYDRWQGSEKQFTCLSNGSYGSLEKFSVTDLKANAKWGGETSLTTCKDVIASQAKGFICLSNGSYGSLEKFTAAEVQSGLKFGGETSLATCKKVTQESTRSYICVSNGSYGSLEKFTLVDRKKRTPIGGETQLQTCLNTIPR